MKMSAMKLKKTLIYLFLAVFTFVQIFPFYWLVTFSFKSNTEIFDSNNLVGLPKVWHFGNYSKALMGGEILRYLLNSVFYAAVTVVVSTLLASMVAYAINRMYWKAKGIVAAIFSLGIMIPVQATLLPLFQGLDRLGIRGGYLGLMLPYITFSLPMTIFLLTGFFKSMPGELIEAAAIDGCGIYRIFFRIALPLCRTGLFVSGLMTFVGNWNELLLAMVFISDPAKKTLPVTLTYFVGPYATNYVQMFAAIIIAIAPTVIVYCLFSNQIVEGLTTGAVKG